MVLGSGQSPLAPSLLPRFPTGCILPSFLKFSTHHHSKRCVRNFLECRSSEQKDTIFRFGFCQIACARTFRCTYDLPQDLVRRSPQFSVASLFPLSDVFSTRRGIFPVGVPTISLEADRFFLW